MQSAGQALQRSLGTDVLETEANALLVAGGFQIEEPETEEPELTAEALLVILRSKLKALQNGDENAIVKRSHVLFGLVTFYSDLETREVVNVFEAWESAYSRAQRKQNAIAEAELLEAIAEAEELTFDEIEEEPTEEELADIRLIAEVFTNHSNFPCA